MNHPLNLHSPVRTPTDTDCGKLFETYGKALYTFVYRYVLNRHEAEEIIQETFVRVLKNKKSIPAGNEVRAWLYTIARNVALNHLRQRKIQQKYQITALQEQLPTHTITENTEQSLWVNHEVTLLPSHLQSVYHLRIAGKTYQEISEKLGVPEGTIKSRVFTIVSTLRENWKKWNVSN